MNNFEEALNKLDRIEQNLNNQADEITFKDNRLTQLVLDSQNKDLTIEELQQKITKKDTRIKEQWTRIEKSISILKNQKKNIEQKEEIIQKLEKELKNSEPKDAHVYEFITYLQKDLKLEKETKKIVEERIKELEEQTKNDELERDKELQELKKKVNTLTVQLEQVIKSDKLVFDLLGQSSKKENLLLRAQEVVDIISFVSKMIVNISEKTKEEIEAKVNEISKHSFSEKNLFIYLNLFINDYNKRPTQQQLNQIQNQLNSTRQELDKEKGWWDKWINVANECEQYGYFGSRREHQYLSRKGITNKKFSFTIETGHDENTIKYSFFGIPSIYESKKLIQLISEYYNQ